MSGKITGIVLSGTGRGAKFIALPIYENIFTELLGHKPFHGTLNIKVPKEAVTPINQSFKQGRVFDNLEYEGKKYGGIITIPLHIECDNDIIDAVGVRPMLTVHDETILEIVCHKHLRNCLDLKDGDPLTVSLE